MLRNKYIHFLQWNSQGIISNKKNDFLNLLDITKAEVVLLGETSSEHFLNSSFQANGKIAKWYNGYLCARRQRNATK